MNVSRRIRISVTIQRLFSRLNGIHFSVTYFEKLKYAQRGSNLGSKNHRDIMLIIRLRETL